MIEYRLFDIQQSVDEESRKVSGYGAVFESQSSDLGFYEVIARGAITDETIMSSDVFATLNHDPEKVLARSNKGQGSLKLNVDERGLHYEFDSPNTTLGNDLLEYLKRGDISQSSFAFVVDGNDKDAQKWEKRDGKIYRTIYKIKQLFDVAPVWSAAYPQANCSLRNKPSDYEEEIRALEEEKQEEIAEIEPKTEEIVENSDDAENSDIHIQNTDVVEEETRNDEVKAEQEESKEEETDNTSAESTLEEEKEVELKSKITTQKMEKRFSFIRAINSIANNKPMDSIDAAVINKGAEELRASGLTFGGQIQLPVSELRDAISVATEGEDIVATDLYDIMTPLRAKNVLAQAGAKFLSGLKGDVQVPIMGAGNVAWADENAEAADASILFDNVTLSPHRLTAYVNISKQMLAQSSYDVEQLIREELVNAVNSKLESTILSDTSSVYQPDGIFYNASVLASATTMAKIAEAEQSVEEANVLGECKWIVSPKFKATLRSKAKGDNVSESLWKDGEIDGTQALVTSNVGSGYGVYGDFSNLAIGNWASIDVTVDPYTKAKNGMIVLVVNAYFDAKVLRPGAFKCAKVTA